MRLFFYLLKKDDKKKGGLQFGLCFGLGFQFQVVLRLRLLFNINSLKVY